MAKQPPPRRKAKKPPVRPRKPAKAAGDSPVRPVKHKVWRDGALFHNVSRYPRRPDVRHSDRLAGILKNGLVAPGLCKDGSVSSDLRLTVTGTAIPYTSLVFLHRYGPQSSIYTIYEPGRFVVFVDPSIPVITQEEMGEPWPILCMDEVYVRERVTIEQITGIAVHEADADAVRTQFAAEFERLGITLYLLNGTVLWPPPKAPSKIRGRTRRSATR